jgi:hypothetical protein
MRFPTVLRGLLQRPIIPLMVETVGGQRLIVDALVDTGADRVFFPQRSAIQLGIDLSAIPTATVTTALGTTGSFAPVELFLELRQLSEILRWKTTAGFLNRPMIYAILGTKGFFEFFTLKYDWPHGTLDIDPAGPLPS